jgi:hypothetical protein
VEFDLGHGQKREIRDLTIFHRHDANEPTSKKAAWVLQLVRMSGQCPDPSALNFALARRIFRSDIFEKAAEFRREVRSRRARETNESSNETKIEPELAEI